MTKNLNVNPYFDDFDESKQFQQILFKPGYAVQARELTQMQSILKNQIDKFGSSIYKSGSVITGGQTFINNKVISMKLDSAYQEDINLNQLVGLYAKGQNSEIVSEIVMVIPATADDKRTLVYQLVSTAGTNGIYEDSEIVDFFTDIDCTLPFGASVQTDVSTSTTTTMTCEKDNDYITVASTTGINVGDRVISNSITPNTYVTSIVGTNVYVTGKLNFLVDIASTVSFHTDNCQPTVLVSVGEGTFFVKGDFLYVAPQTIILDKYRRNASYIIGLTHIEEVVTAADDATLLDNAFGSYNYAAPGADRLKIPLVLSKVPFVDNTAENVTTENFFEILRIIDGNIISQKTVPEYSELNTTLARRTYEESGNYLVQPFMMNLKNDTKFDTVLLGDISDGKAYVRGNEIEKISSTQIRINKSRAIESLENYNISSNYGSYVYVSGLTNNIPNINTAPELELHNIATPINDSTLIGHANIKFLEYSSGSGSSIVYKAYLFNIRLIGAASFGLTRSLLSQTSSYTNITSKLTIASSGISLGIAQLYNATPNLLIFDIPQSYVSEVSEVQYTTRRVYSSVTFSSGTATITSATSTEQFVGGSGLIAQSVAEEYFAIIHSGTGTVSSIGGGQFIPLNGSGRTVTIPVVGVGSLSQAVFNINDSSFNGTCTIIATLRVTIDDKRIKTLVEVNKAIPVALIASTISLGKSDVYSIKAIYESINADPATTASTNITSKYTLDNGQRDAFYDHGSIILKSGMMPPSHPILVVFDHFTHAGVSASNVKSYAVDYTSIPTYTDSTGELHYLRDCVDFRPRRVDDASGYTFQGFLNPDPSFLEINHSYYLSRTDKVVLSAGGQFKVISGISSYTNPQPPADLDDAMTLYTVVLPPYTNTIADIRLIYENNRRYTMKDISKLDRRLENVEYYTALNSLEQSVINQSISSPTGVELFKNGILTDSFNNFTVSEVGHPDFKCAIDTVKGFARAPFRMNNAQLLIDSSLTSTARKTGDLITAPYTEQIFAAQLQSTSWTNVNPFNVISSVGNLKLVPSSDVWYDTKSLPVVNVHDENTNAFMSAQQQAQQNNTSVSWGEWNYGWSGSTSDVTGTTSTKTGTRYKTQQSVSSNTVTNAETRVVTKDTIPYMRGANVRFDASGLPPNTQIFAWLDGVNITSYVTIDSIAPAAGFTGIADIIMTNNGSLYTETPTVTISAPVSGTTATAYAELLDDGSIKVNLITYGTGYTSVPTVTITRGAGDTTGVNAVARASLDEKSSGFSLWTNAAGGLSGVVNIPNNNITNFIAGHKRIIFNDSSESPIYTNSYAEAHFLAQGYINNTQTTITSTRVPIFDSYTISEDNSWTTFVAAETTAPPIVTTVEETTTTTTKQPTTDNPPAPPAPPPRPTPGPLIPPSIHSQSTGGELWYSHYYLSVVGAVIPLSVVIEAYEQVSYAWYLNGVIAETGTIGVNSNSHQALVIQQLTPGIGPRVWSLTITGSITGKTATTSNMVFPGPIALQTTETPEVPATPGPTPAPTTAEPVVRSIAYSNSVFTESTNNNGTIANDIFITLVNDTFTGVNGSGLGSVSGVPAGLTVSLVKTSPTTATLSLSGTATAHANADDTTITVTFGNSDFGGGNTYAVANSVFSLSINFNDPAATTAEPTPAPTTAEPAYLTYGGSFLESNTLNDGSIETYLAIAVFNDLFTGPIGGSLGSVTGVPAGLTANLVRSTANTAILTLTGNAIAHANANDTTITVTFGNSDFMSGNANGVAGRQITTTIDFYDPAATTAEPTTTAPLDPPRLIQVTNGSERELTYYHITNYGSAINVGIISLREVSYTWRRDGSIVSSGTAGANTDTWQGLMLSVGVVAGPATYSLDITSTLGSLSTSVTLPGPVPVDAPIPVAQTSAPVPPVVPPVPKPVPVALTFMDATASKADAIYGILSTQYDSNIGNIPASIVNTVTAMMDAVVEGYNIGGAAQPARQIGSQTGLPDLGGAIWWAMDSIAKGLSTEQAKNAVIGSLQSSIAAGVTVVIDPITGQAKECAPGKADPLAQTFFVNPGKNPDGIFLSSVSLFFKTKDANRPVHIELRPTVNGYPSSSLIIPFSQVTINSAQVNISENGTVGTTVSFDAPVYLAPGEYALVIKTNSDKYNMFVAEIGKKLLIDSAKTISQQPYIGSLFKSQNASTWTAAQEYDLCFLLNKCEFKVGTTKQYLKAWLSQEPFQYDMMNVMSQNLSFGNKTNISLKVAPTLLNGSTPEALSNILLGTDTNFGTRYKHYTLDDLKFEYTLSTTSRDVSPVIDLERAAVILVENIINSKSTVTGYGLPETEPYGGSAEAKYVSKKVTLADNFDATNLVVYVDINRPPETSIEVYYKTQSVFDTTDFNALPWTLMNQEISGGFTSKDGEFVEDKWSAYDIEYTNGTTTYDEYRSFQVKVVMYSTNRSIVPSIADIREIALA